jgi:ribosomal-protein-alanine N-acetyltransferase
VVNREGDSARGGGWIKLDARRDGRQSPNALSVRHIRTIFGFRLPATVRTQLVAEPGMNHLATPRLTLTPLQLADTDDLHRLWTAPGVRQYLWDDAVIPAEQTAGVVQRSRTLFDERGLGLWGARLRDAARAGRGDSLAGFVGYWYFRDPPELELLYGVSEELWGRGLATELARTMVEYAWASLGFAEVRASTDAGNVASARVLEKLGFTLERREPVAGLDTLFYLLSRPTPANS